MRRARRLHATRAPARCSSGFAERSGRSPTSAGRSRPTRRGASRRSSSTASASSRRAAASIPTRSSRRTLLGYVGIDNKGLSGIESAYDSQIRGKDGTVLVTTDGRAARLQPRRAAADRRLDDRADDRQVPAAHRRARAARGRASRTAPPAARAIILDPAHRRDPRDGQRADVQSERLSRIRRNRRGAIAPSRISTSRARPSRSSPRRPRSKSSVMPIDRDRSTPAPGIIRIGNRVIDEYRGHNYGVLSFSDVHRQVEQRRRDQDRLQARHRAAEPLRRAVRIRPAGLAGLSRREPRHRLEIRRSGPRARSPRCRWATRSA